MPCVFGRCGDRLLERVVHSGDTTTTTSAATTTTVVLPVETSTPTTAATSTPTTAAHQITPDAAIQTGLGEPPTPLTVYGYPALTEVNPDDLEQTITETLGAPNYDSGWQTTTETCPDVTQTRTLQWADLTVILEHHTTDNATWTYFAGWSIGPHPFALLPQPPDPTTEPSGIGLDVGIHIGDPVSKIDTAGFAQTKRDGNSAVGLVMIAPIKFQLDDNGTILSMGMEPNDC